MNTLSHWGAVAHYAADNSGHRLATNLSVAILYPGLAHKYGHAVTYEDKPSAHLKVEYGFDVDQVAKGQYAPKAYHDFIGFAVSKPVLERAFTKTYSLDLSSVFFRWIWPLAATATRSPPLFHE